MPLTHPYSRRYSSKYFSKYLAIFFLLFFSFFSLSLNTSWKSCRRELSLSEIGSYNCISSSTFYIPRIDKSLGDHKTHVPPYIPLPSVSSNKKLEEIFGPWSWNAAICLSASPPPPSRMNIQRIHRKAVERRGIRETRMIEFDADSSPGRK